MSTQTHQNLIKAFEGESQARNKYTFFAAVARSEGWMEIADVFEETAKNEQEHAEVIAKLLEIVGDSKQNLHTAIGGETYEYTEMYPHFEKVAREEGENKAAAYFKLVQQVEEMHAKRFQALLDSLANNTLQKKEQPIAWRCSECGYTYLGTEPPKICPLCGHAHGYFQAVKD